MTLCAPLMIPRFAGRCASSGPPSCSLSLAFEGWSPLEAVSIDLEGRRVLELFPLPMAADAAPGGATPGGAAPSLGAALSTLPCHVVIEHLQSRQDLNGARARATAFDAAQGRYHVVVDETSETLALRAANVRELLGAEVSVSAEALQPQVRSAVPSPPLLIHSRPPAAVRSSRARTPNATPVSHFIRRRLPSI